MARLVELESGDVFAGDYRVVKLLRRGGMGAVYVAEQISTSEQRALKLMLPEIVEKPQLRKRFELEARVGARIKSDHVVKTIQSGVEGSTPWLAMELLEGEDLEAYAEARGPLPPAEVREIFAQLCHALGAAHTHEDIIVHSDLKTENIFRAKSHQRGLSFMIKVLDFGIARVVVEATTVGRTKEKFASIFWAAPEQAKHGVPITPATDVWALGLIAFRLLTGKLFWRTKYDPAGTDVMWLMEAFVDPMPTASARAAEYGCVKLVPEGFDAWFAGCVSRDAGKRYKDASAAFEALEWILTRAEQAVPRVIVQPKLLATAATAPIPEVQQSALMRDAGATSALAHAEQTSALAGSRTEPVPEAPPLLDNPPRPKLPTRPVPAPKQVVLPSMGTLWRRIVAILEAWTSNAWWILAVLVACTLAMWLWPNRDKGETPPSPHPWPSEGAQTAAPVPAGAPAETVTTTATATATAIVVQSGPAPQLPDEELLKRQLEPKMRSGRASLDELKMLKALCSHLGDHACRNAAAAAIAAKTAPSPPDKPQPGPKKPSGGDDPYG